MQKESRENRPQFTSVDYPSISEEPVEPQSFRSVLTRALGWTAFVPLFMLAFLQSQQLQRMVDVTNHQQLLTAQMIADSFDNKVEQIGRLLILSYPDLISEADHESAYRHLIAIAPQIVSIERAHVGRHVAAHIGEGDVERAFPREPSLYAAAASANQRDGLPGGNLELVVE